MYLNYNRLHFRYWYFLAVLSAVSYGKVAKNTFLTKIPFHHGNRLDTNVSCLKAILHEAIFLATCNATMTNKEPFKLQRGCYTQATCLATLRKVEGRSTFLATHNATIAVAKWGVTRKATFVAL